MDCGLISRYPLSCLDQPYELQECSRCQYQQECNDYYSYFKVKPGEESKNFNRFMVLASGISTMVTGFFILLHPKFQRHPYRIYAFASLSEALMYTMNFYTNFVCEFNMPQIMTWTLALPKVLFGLQTWPESNLASSDLNHMRVQ